jgi:two-component system chemotaxis sensor kinase CheA
MDAMAAIRQTFFEECEEQLAELESGLIAMNEGTADRETVNAVFRAVHSIKGGAGAFKLNDLVAFAHTFETTLDHIRSDRLTACHEAMQVMLRAADVLADLVRMSRTGDEIPPSLWTQLAKDLEAMNPGGSAGSDLSAAAHDASPGGGDHAGGEDDLAFAPAMIEIGTGTSGDEQPETPLNEFKVRFRCSPALYEKANEPAFLLRELRRLGKCQISCEIGQLPAFEQHDNFGSHLSWDVLVLTEKSISDVRDVFEFVDGDCILEVEDITPPADAPAAAAPEDLTFAVEAELAEPEDHEPTPAIAPAIAAVMETIAAAAPGSSDSPLPSLEPESKAKSDLHKEAASSSASTPSNSTIRVELERVDRLINLVGELVINQAMLAQRVIGEGFASSSPVMLGLDELEQLTREIQESVMAIRAQPVKPLFQRMSRIIREVCNATGKNVRLKVEGDTTEVDKTVIERLADPLTHMIRNAVDHGIESAEVRAKAGKPPEGTVRLSAAHRSGRVVIEISDDGAGLNRKRILEKAKSKGLVPPEAVLSESEIDNLLFLPGFSTAETVSSISGRGVGMDVVRRSIQALGGRISIASNEGKGSVFSMSLPLTLAILDGMIVSVAGQTLVVPLTSIVETFKPPRGSVHSLGTNSSVVQIRDTFVPVVDVGQRLGFSQTFRHGVDGVAILVETEGGERHALLVDGIQDQRQVVIKSLETNYGAIEGIAAATILGDGRVALILDVEAAVNLSGISTQSHIAA